MKQNGKSNSTVYKNIPGRVNRELKLAVKNKTISIYISPFFSKHSIALHLINRAFALKL